RKGDTLDELHDEERRSFIVAELERFDDVRVADPRCHARFTQKSRALRVARAMRQEALDGDEPVEAVCADETPHVDGAHAAARDREEDAAAAEPRGPRTVSLLPATAGTRLAPRGRCGPGRAPAVIRTHLRERARLFPTHFPRFPG